MAYSDVVKVALGQINPTVGDFSGNAAKIIQFAGQARAPQYGVNDMAIARGGSNGGIDSCGASLRLTGEGARPHTSQSPHAELVLLTGEG
jgi:hypothetical protein